MRIAKAAADEQRVNEENDPCAISLVIIGVPRFLWVPRLVRICTPRINAHCCLAQRLDANLCPAVGVAEHVGGRVHDHLERRLDQREAAPEVPVEDAVVLDEGHDVLRLRDEDI